MRKILSRLVCCIALTRCVYSQDTEPLITEEMLEHFHVVTYATHKHPNLFKLMLSCRLHLVRLQVLGFFQPWRGFGDRLLKVKEYVASLPDTDIVMHIDAFDVLLVKDKADILSKFLEMQAPLIVSGEKNCWPRGDLASLYPFSPEEHRYINAGGYIGYVKDVKRLLSSFPIHPSDDDQLLLTLFYVNAPEGQKLFRIDDQSQIFLSLWGVKEEEVLFDQERGCVRFTPTGSEPAILHANGGSFLIWDKAYQELFADKEETPKRRHRRR